ncbi:MAG: HD domain-containing protein [Desulfobulbaceae bacterium]|nr:HD domain-containing protein [Desulfobulbaceae bacterium]
MLANIRAHSLLVTNVAEEILDGLMEKNESGVSLPEKELVLAGALLHDIAKTICLQQDCLHAQKGRDICLEHGYPAISEIVCEHVLLKEFSPERYAQGIFFAKEIVYYADKRVCHDTIVSIEERLAYILERYGNNDEERFQRIKDNFKRCRILEGHLFSRINFAPDELAEKVAISGKN